MDGLKSRVSDIEFQMQSPDFWKDREKSSTLSQELNGLKEEISFWDNFEKKLKEYLNLDDKDLSGKENEIVAFEKSFNGQYIKIFLGGEYDKNNALIYIYSGAGGVDAQDWASMLLRMYMRYAARAGIEAKIIDQRR